MGRSRGTDWGPHIHMWVQGPDQAWRQLMALGMVVAASSIYDRNMTDESRVPALGVRKCVLDAAPARLDLEPYLVI
jgi:hypothetical protein